MSHVGPKQTAVRAAFCRSQKCDLRRKSLENRTNVQTRIIKKGEIIFETKNTAQIVQAQMTKMLSVLQ
jgi:hypothetical protein